jgi:hypothetical protein
VSLAEFTGPALDLRLGEIGKLLADLPLETSEESGTTCSRQITDVVSRSR